MSEARLDVHKLQAVELLPPIGEWAWGGFKYVGGEVRLGRNIDLLRWGTVIKFAKLAPEVKLKYRLGGLLLASVGKTQHEICRELHFEKSRLNPELRKVEDILRAPQAGMLCTAATRLKVLRVKYGPVSNFSASPRDLLKLGLAARVERGNILAAYGLTPGGFGAELNKISERNHVRKTAGSIAAAMVTHQLDVNSSVPQVTSTRTRSGFESIVPVVDWEVLVRTENEEAFVERFRALELHKV